jgi:SAM-dependent methyltransferase
MALSFRTVQEGPLVTEPKSFMPAMPGRWMRGLYDPLTQLLGVRRLHADLLARADLRAGQQVLEIGCGTGNLLLLAARRAPGVQLVGLDPDPTMLRRAAGKALRAGLRIQLDLGYASELPYADASVDRVLSALMFHHVDAEDQQAALREVARVLRPGGQFHLVDPVGGGRPHFLGRRGHGHEHPAVDLDALLAAAGFVDVRSETREFLRQPMAFYRAAV